MAVPCWSSWKTGMSSRSSRRRSISKQRGAEISSRLMPPKPGAISWTARTISSGSCVSRQSGQASTPANSLNSIALPSITGSAAPGPMSPRPRTAEPSVTTAMVLPLPVRFQTLSGSSAMARETRATPGVYAIERSSRVRIGTFADISILPPLCIRNVRSETLRTRMPSIALIASTTRSPCSSLAHRTLMSRTTESWSTRTRSIAPRIASASPIAAATRANCPGSWGISARIVRL